MAYEKTVEGVERLYPTARLQLVRELFVGEWQERTQRLGETLYPLYAACWASDDAEAALAAGSSGAGPSGASAAVSGGDGLSEYEQMRNAQILENQRKLIELGLFDEYARPHTRRVEMDGWRPSPARSLPRLSPR